MKSLVTCLFAVAAFIASASIASAQCGLNGTAQCGAPVVGSLNQQLAQLQAINVPSGAAASASTSVGGFAGQQVFQPAQAQYSVYAPQPQYVMAPQPQYITVPQTQMTVTLPQVQFGAQAVTAYAQTPQYVTAPQYVVSSPQFVTAPTASASTSASASTALPLVAPALALNSGGCSSCSRSRARSSSGGGALAALLAPRSVSKSRSSVTTRN